MRKLVIWKQVKSMETIKALRKENTIVLYLAQNNKCPTNVLNKHFPFL